MTGPPLANTNAATHYLRCALPKLPEGCSHIRKQTSELRSALEGALEARAVETGPYQAVVIAAVCRWFRHGQLSAMWLRQELGSLSPADRLRFSEATAKSGDNMVRLLGLLGLDRQDQGDIFTALYDTPPAIPIDNGDTAPQPDAPEHPTADVQDDATDADAPPEQPQAAEAACEERGPASSTEEGASENTQHANPLS